MTFGDYRLTWQVNSLSIGPDGQHFRSLGKLLILEFIRFYGVLINIYFGYLFVL